MLKLKNLYILLITLLFSVNIFSQIGKLEGRITDLETGQPLIGANIWLEGTKIGAATGNQGKYIIIRIPSGDYNIIANYIGFHKTETTKVKISPGSTKKLDIALSPDYDLIINPVIEKFYLETLNATTRNDLKEIKSVSEDNYFRLLQKIYFDFLVARTSNSKESNEKIERDNQIQILTIKSNLYALRYKNSASEKEKKQIKTELKKTLDKLFTYIQDNRENDLANLKSNLSELEKSLNSLKYHKDEVINRRIDELLN